MKTETSNTITLIAPHRSSDRTFNKEQLFEAFCDEQPNVVSFVTKYSAGFFEPEVFTGCALKWAQMIWEQYLKAGAEIPTIDSPLLERLYIYNKRFIEEEISPNRDGGFSAAIESCHSRKQLSLRIWMMAVVSEYIQPPGTQALDEEANAQDQDLGDRLVGTLIDAFDEVSLVYAKINAADSTDLSIA